MQLSPRKVSKTAIFSKKMQNFLTSGGRLCPAPTTFFGVNTCNLAKLGQKRTIFKRVFDFAKNFDIFQVFASPKILFWLRP